MAQITITPNQAAALLVQKLTGKGVTVSNPLLTCANVANGVFTAVTPANIGIDSGIILCTGDAANAAGPASQFVSTDNKANGDAFLDAYIGGTTKNACALEFDFKPAGDTIKFDYVFASEEYTDYSCTTFNDVFGFFITGPNITGTKNLAIIPNTTIPVTINSTVDTLQVNISTLGTGLCRSMGPGAPFGMYYAGQRIGSTYNGFTKVLTAIQKVIPCSTYHLRLIIADVGDEFFDSGVWLRAGSLSSKTATIRAAGLSTANNVPYCVRGCYPGTFSIYRSDTTNTTNPLIVHFQIGGTAVNGTDYSFIPDSVTIGVGQKKSLININALTSATGAKTVKIFVYAPSCNPSQPPIVIDSAELNILDTLRLEMITHDTTICAGTALPVAAIGDTAYNYSWSPTIGTGTPSIIDTNVVTLIQPDTTRTYTLTASFPGCPDVKRSITLGIEPIPVVDAGRDTGICQWDTLRLHAKVKPTWYTNYRYQWSPGNDLNNTTQSDPVLTGNLDTKLQLTVTTAIGCVDSDSVNITVHPGNFAAGTPDAGICPEDTTTLQVTGGQKFKWVPSNYLSNDTDSIVRTYSPVPIDYTVYVTNQYGCRDTVIIPITLFPAAVLYLGDDLHLYPGEKYQMDAKGNCVAFSWFPNVGLNATNIYNPVISPTVYTRYYVTGVTAGGCSTTDTINVYTEQTVLDVPNAFNPGSLNNELKIVKRGIATLKYFRIFNRWGAKVFESNDINKGWDGRYNGEEQPEGVYVYIVDAETDDGRHFYKQGNVTLIR